MKSKKLIIPVVALSMAFACAALTACGNSVELVANDAQDLLQEDFGIAVKKSDSEVLAAVNAVVDEWIDNGDMDKYVEYYSALGDENAETPTAPTGLKLTWDLGSYTNVLHMYTESGFAPYEFVSTVSAYPVEGGGYSVAGIDVAIACQVAENLECKLVIHDVDFDTIISSLNAQSGKALAAAGITISEERAAQVNFSNVYSSSTLTIVSVAGTEYHTLAELDGLKIGVQEGTSGDLIASQAKKSEGYTYTYYDDDDNELTSEPIKLSSKTEIVQMKSYAALAQALKSGKIDVIFMDKAPALLLIKNA